MINFYKEVLKRLVCFIFPFLFVVSFPHWKPGFHPEYCVDLMNRSMHNFISRNASISHFTKRRKEKLETVDSGYRLQWSEKCLKPFFFSIAKSHLSDCRFVYRFSVPNFVIILAAPSEPFCRDFFCLFCFVVCFLIWYHSLLWRYIDCYVCSINVAITNVFGSKLSNIKI